MVKHQMLAEWQTSMCTGTGAPFSPPPHASSLCSEEDQSLPSPSLLCSERAQSSSSFPSHPRSEKGQSAPSFPSYPGSESLRVCLRSPPLPAQKDVNEAPPTHKDVCS